MRNIEDNNYKKTFHNTFLKYNSEPKTDWYLFRNYSLAYIITIIIQKISNMEDNNITKFIKLLMISVPAIQICNYVFDVGSRFLNITKFNKIFEEINYNIIMIEDYDYSKYIQFDLENMNQEKIGDKYILHLDDSAVLEETFDNDTYKCYYIDDENVMDLTKEAKKILKRR